MRLKYPLTPNIRPKTSVVWMSLAVLIFLIWSFSPFQGGSAQGSPGTLSFTQANINVNESDAEATITLTRTGGTDGQVTAKVNLADATTSPSDYRFSPGALDPTFAQVPQASFFFYNSQIALQPDGKVLVAANNSIFRVNPDGSPDSSFSAGALNGAQFTTLFPSSMTPTEFVDALIANTGDPLNPGAGGALTPAERDQLIMELTFGDKTRAQVIRAIAENQEYRRRQFNKAFVLMQYFGYLRRNPNSSPDVNFNGYNFWLAKLNQFNGNFIDAEMVKAFISSSELRQRFGQP